MGRRRIISRWFAEETGALLNHALGERTELTLLDLDGFMKLYSPLVPVVRRDFAEPRYLGAELAEDVIANIRIIDRIGALPVSPASSYVYRIRTGSIAHSGDSAARFESAYSAYIAKP